MGLTGLYLGFLFNSDLKGSQLWKWYWAWRFLLLFSYRSAVLRCLYGLLMLHRTRNFSKHTFRQRLQVPSVVKGSQCVSTVYRRVLVFIVVAHGSFRCIKTHMPHGSFRFNVTCLKAGSILKDAHMDRSM